MQTASCSVDNCYASALYVTAVRGNVLDPVETELQQPAGDWRGGAEPRVLGFFEGSVYVKDCAYEGRGGDLRADEVQRRDEEFSSRVGGDWQVVAVAVNHESAAKCVAFLSAIVRLCSWCNFGEVL
jgi:hypothetical protein